MTQPRGQGGLPGRGDISNKARTEKEEEVSSWGLRNIGTDVPGKRT